MLKSCKIGNHIVEMTGFLINKSGEKKGMTKPSVVFVNRVYPPVRGATGRVLRDLARAFSDKGWKVTVITTGAKNVKEYDGNIQLIRKKIAPKGRRMHAYVGAWFKMFWTLMFLPRHDVIVTMTDPPMLVVAGRLACFFKRSKHIHWCQDLYPDLLPYIGMKLPNYLMGFFRKLSRKSMRKCDKVIVIGRCMARQLTHAGIDPRHITVIPNWPDNELIANNNGAAQGRVMKKALHIIDKVDGARAFDVLRKDSSGAKFRVLYSGNLGRAHPLHTILDAAAYLNNENPEVEFVFVGDGPSFERLAKERSQRGLDNVRLIPYQPASRIRDIMESGDLHLITMKHEIEGMLVPCKLYSALAVGRPCIFIGPEQSETARVIKDFKAGSIVPQGDSYELAQAILRYRFNREDWFSAYEGANYAGSVFVPSESMDAWIKRANDVVGDVVNDNRDKAA